MASYPTAPPYQEYPAKPPMPGFQPPPPTYVLPAVPVMTQPQPPVFFGPESITLTCPNCNVMISTETSKKHKTCTHLLCCLLFWSMGCSLFSCLPYFFCDPEAVEHTCPQCHTKIGEWHDS